MKAHDWHTEIEGTGNTVCRRCGAVYHRCSGGAERAVIEAAKAWRRTGLAEDSELHLGATLALIASIDALQEARDDLP